MSSKRYSTIAADAFTANPSPALEVILKCIREGTVEQNDAGRFTQLMTDLYTDLKASKDIRPVSFRHKVLLLLRKDFIDRASKFPSSPFALNSHSANVITGIFRQEFIDIDKELRLEFLKRKNPFVSYRPIESNETT